MRPSVIFLSITKKKTSKVRSTWPEDIIDDEGNCLPYDGSKVPDCSEYIDPDHYVPYYHEHSFSKNSLCRGRGSILNSDVPRL